MIEEGGCINLAPTPLILRMCLAPSLSKIVQTILAEFPGVLVLISRSKYKFNLVFLYCPSLGSNGHIPLLTFLAFPACHGCGHSTGRAFNITNYCDVTHSTHKPYQNAFLPNKKFWFKSPNHE